VVPDTLSTSIRRRYTKSSSFAMALVFTVLCGLVAVTLGYFINYFAKDNFIQSTQAILDSEIRYLDTLSTIPTASDGRAFILLQEGSDLPDQIVKPMSVLSEGLLLFTTTTQEGTFAARVHTTKDGQKLLVGTDVSSILEDLEFMQWIGAISIVFVTIVVSASFVISIFVVNGTNKIVSTAYEIIRTGDLSRRVEVFSRWDDLSNVANVLNLLLARIGVLMTGVRQVSDNIAHDLRTPLTRMRNHIEDMQNTGSDPENYGKLLSEADHILGTFNALHRISRIETEKRRSHFTDIDLELIIHDVIDFYQPLAEDKEIAIAMAIEPARFVGDRDLLFQAFANILDNAIKYAPYNGRVHVVLRTDRQSIVIAVENTGAQLASDELGRIFDRFYRAEKSRSEPGTGLGLSLVAAVISLHDGKVWAQNTVQGVKIITELPRKHMDYRNVTQQT